MHSTSAFCINYEERLVAVTEALAAAQRDQRWTEVQSLRLAQEVLEAVVAERSAVTGQLPADGA
jgi:hypothetical protein